jgi:hypothetical protein
MSAAALAALLRADLPSHLEYVPVLPGGGEVEVSHDGSALGVLGSALPALHAAGWAAVSSAEDGALSPVDGAAVLLIANPSHLTAWNTRKRAASSDDALRREVDFTALVLSRHPKAGEAWAHRWWAVEGLLRAGALGEAGVRAELAAVSAAISRRPRCYPAWTHRHKLVAALTVQAAQCGTPCLPLPSLRALLLADLSSTALRARILHADYSVWHGRAVTLAALSRLEVAHLGALDDVRPSAEVGEALAAEVELLAEVREGGCFDLVLSYHARALAPLIVEASARPA